MNRAHRAAQAFADTAATVLVHLGIAHFPEDRPRPGYDARAGFPTAPSRSSTVGGTVTKDPLQGQHIREASDKLRDLGRRLPRWWPSTIDGRHVLVDDATGAELAELNAAWTRDLLQFYDAINGTTLCSLAELLWNLSCGDARSAIATAEQMIKWMGLGPDGPRKRGEPFHNRTDVGEPQIAPDAAAGEAVAGADPGGLW